MANIVAGFLVPHDPLMGAFPDAPALEQRNRCVEAFDSVARRLIELEVDTAVLICDDHYTINGPTSIPMAMIAVGDVEGPMESWLNISKRTIENNEMLATHIFSYGLEKGVDWTVSKSLTTDHAFMIPYHFCVSKVPAIRTIPIYLNSGVEPFIPSRRAHDIGRTVGDAIRNWAGNERVAIIGTGGVSHWPGMKEMGRVNEAWDRHVLNFTLKGDVHSLIAMPDEDILEHGGNGGIEIKNWIAAMGACGPIKGELIAYEAVPEWIAGCAFAELHLLH